MQDFSSRISLRSILATLLKLGKSDTIPHGYVDHAQKLFPIVPGMAIGFVGNLEVASCLLHSLFSQIGNRQHQDPLSLSMWVPRLFRLKYAELATRVKHPDIAFMVAYALRCRPNVVERKTVSDIVRRIARGEYAVKRNWMPETLLNILRVPAEHVPIAGTSLSRLYVMRSPNFNIEVCAPLQFAAIGSGESVFEEIAQFHGMIVAGDHTNLSDGIFWLREAMTSFIQTKNIQSVGGLFPVLKITGQDVEAFGMSLVEISVGGTKIELTIENGRWTQRNLTTGKEIPLLPPWEIRPTDRQNRVFDDLKDAF